MPKEHTLINDTFDEVIKEYTKNTSSLSLTQSEKDDMQMSMLQAMKDRVRMLESMHRITKEYAKSAYTAIEFYDQNVRALKHQQHPASVLQELSAIDYSQDVEIKKVKPGRILTQMQRPGTDDVRVGSFYTDGILPSDFQDRAQKSGIGHLYANKSTANIEQKSVYQLKTADEVVFLQSVAAPIQDTWSAGEVQDARGGGVQYRIATKDHGKLELLNWGELEASRSISSGLQKRLKKGMTSKHSVSQLSSHLPRSNKRKATDHSR